MMAEFRTKALTSLNNLLVLNLKEKNKILASCTRYGPFYFQITSINCQERSDLKSLIHTSTRCNDKTDIEKKYARKSTQSNYFYAVKVGRKPGVYLSWPDCLEQVNKFSNFDVQKFKSEGEAWRYLNGKTETVICYYAVKAGKRPGIYYSWEDCKAQIKGFPAAVYTKCETEEEAANYLRGSGTQTCFYAVKHGKKPGLYHSWFECQQQVVGYPKPLFKRFSTEEKALQYLKATASQQRALFLKQRIEQKQEVTDENQGLHEFPATASQQRALFLKQRIEQKQEVTDENYGLHEFPEQKSSSRDDF